MSEEKKQEQEDEVLKAVREEYEKKLEEQRKELEAEKQKALDEQEAKHVKQIRALLSGQGKGMSDDEEQGQEQEPASKEEALYADLQERFHLK
ncbi:MAG: hypothetical protein J6T10_15335 [Methanobrevibacter sp.]|nr:hypothetical protein [Methanobrevibacter sp.]